MANMDVGTGQGKGETVSTQRGKGVSEHTRRYLHTRLGPQPDLLPDRQKCPLCLQEQKFMSLLVVLHEDVGGAVDVEVGGHF